MGSSHIASAEKRLRLCGDYKVSANQAVETETYPLPRLEELLATLSGGKVFSKIDSPSIFQRIMENLMKDLPVVVFLDDMLLMGRSEE